MQKRLKILGIIGGIGSGKSTAATLFQQLGAVVISADDIGHLVLLLPDVKNAITQRWGAAVVGRDGEIDRRKLAAVVFADTEELSYLKSLTHPLIAEEVRRQQEQYKRDVKQLCLLDAPLLLESGWDHMVDLIIFVSAPATVRWNRVKNRGWTKVEWKQRETAQFSVEEKARRAHIVFDNSGNTDHLRTQVETLMRDLVPKG